MFSIIDKYILKRYLLTFLVMLLLFIPIAVIIDISEKINKILMNNAGLSETILYYIDFSIYFTNFLFPIFLFLSVIWFTSKLANTTEIIAILSSGTSYNRFLRPYIIGASIISVLILLMGFFILPNASKGYNNFKYKYLKTGVQDRETTDVYRQISDSEFIYVSNFNQNSATGYNFVFEKFNKNKLVYKISANTIQYNSKTKNYTLYGYQKRIVGSLNDQIIIKDNENIKFNFDLDDLTPVVYIAETLKYTELNNFIEKEKKRGGSNINTHIVVKYKRISNPISAFILTTIAVAVSSMKRRGGMGMNLAIGIGLAFSYVFLDKIFGTIAEKSTFSPLIAVWIPNILYGFLAIYLLKNAKK